MTRLKNILARFKLSLIRRKYVPASIAVPEDMINCKNVLICLPPGQRELTMVKQLLPELSRVFSESEIYRLAAPGSSVYSIFPRKGYRILTPTSQHLTWSGLPKKAYLAGLHETGYKVILDMNLNRHYFSQAILLSFPGAIKIGRANHLGTPFYNLEIKTRYLRDEKNIYKSIIATVDRIKNPAVVNADGTVE